MKRSSLLCLVTALLLALSCAPSFADGWVLGDWSANINGATYNPPPLPGSPSYPTTLGTAIGSVTFTFAGPGSNFVGIYMNPYYDAGFGDTSTAVASVHGVPPGGLSYQLGWPGVPNGSGFTVFDNFAANALDGTNTVGVGGAPPNACCTVALAELFSFNLNSGENGTVTFALSPNIPSGFYIKLTDLNYPDASLYLTETANIGGGEVPEPASILLLASGAAAAWARRRMLRRKA